MPADESPQSSTSDEKAVAGAPRPKWKRRLRRFGLSVGLLIAVIAVAVACVVGHVYCQGKQTPAGNSQYVALGSSFGAGPGVATRAPNSPDLCIRSAQNYAHILASQRGFDLTDMTCSAATAEQVLHGGQYFQGPQIDAVKPSTELVTLTAGGNDISYLGNLFAWSCQSDTSRMPLAWRPLVCDPKSPEEVAASVSRLEDTMVEIGKQVHTRAPHAKLLFVDYTSLLPSAGVCHDRMPITDAQMDTSRALARRLGEITAAAAQKSDAVLVKASEVTAGHDICSNDPWVFPYTFSTTPLNYGPMAYHPTEKAMRAIAAKIEAVLDGQA